MSKEATRRHTQPKKKWELMTTANFRSWPGRCSVLLVLLHFSGAALATCSGPPQSPLLYGVDDYTAASVGLPNAPANESLAEAICCDPTYAGYPEPKGLYAQTDVDLFQKMNRTGVTIFFDSVCGIPLFRAPTSRSFQDFEQETREHGWPSFRAAEVVDGNVLIGDDGVVTSACGTKLGTNEPDASGNRWCMDLVCISGGSSGGSGSAAAAVPGPGLLERESPDDH